MEKTVENQNVLRGLLDVKIEMRDEKWEDDFLSHSAQGHFRLLRPDPITGPDGWPYLLVETDLGKKLILSLTEAGPGAGSQNENPAEPAINILSWLSTRGIGLVINPTGEIPDFVISYGMIWNYRERGQFISRQEHVQSMQAHAESIDIGRLKFFEKNISKMLPDYARKVIRDFFADQGLFAVKVLLVKEEETQPFNLAFSFESMGSPKQEELSGVGEAIAWFLPSHYPILIMSETAIPHFELL